MDNILTIGVEEEYLLVCPETGKAVKNPPKGFMKICRERIGERVTPEFLRCQIEIATGICETVSQARAEIADLRGTIAEIAIDHDMRLMAASTHPFTPWKTQQATEGERYKQLDTDMQGAIRRMMICGMHVHIGLENPEHRIDVQNQMRYFLPHMLALSTSSPFWEGHLMGMKSYRLSVFDGMPRTGIPEEIDSYGEYERLINTIVKAGAIEDSSKIWWDIRPSEKFPTLEMRVCDICTKLDDAMTIAAIYQSLTRRILRLKNSNMKWRVYPAFLISENRWMAQRHGVSGQLIDFGTGDAVPFSHLLDELIDWVSEDAEALGCLDEVLNARNIVLEGSSACRQVDVFEAAKSQGAPKRQALQGVVAHLVKETVEGL
ncbi:carboxylate-amine ligase [Hellea sp.]|nr:carboxylate-amine ligase [Hellea sp.]